MSAWRRREAGHLSTLATYTPGVQAPARPAPSARWERLGFWGLFVALVAACMLSVNFPLDRDEGAFLVVAQLILHGKLPYRDVWDQKPPGIYYLLAALLALTRGLSLQAQIFALRLAAVAANALTGLGLLRCGARLNRPRAGRLAALLWLAACAATIFTANLLFTEPFATAATVWAAVWVLRRPTVRAAFVAGLLLALGAFFKQTAIIALPALILLLYAQPLDDTEGHIERRVRPGGRMSALVALLAGAGLPWLALLGVYASLGAAGDLLYQVVIVNLTSYPAGSEGNVPEYVFFTPGLLYCGPLLLLAFRLAGYLRRLRRPDGLRLMVDRRSALTLVALWLLGILQTLPVFAHPYPHYLIQPMPWIALLLALGLTPPAEGHADQHAPTTAQALRARVGYVGRQALILLPLLIGVQLAIESHSANQRALDAQLATGALIAAHTSPQSRLLVAPAEPEYYYLSGRLPTTRYVYLLQVDRAAFPLAQVTDDIRARRFDVVAWFPASAQDDDPQQFAAMYAALTQTYRQAPASDALVTIFQR